MNDELVEKVEDRDKSEDSLPTTVVSKALEALVEQMSLLEAQMAELGRELTKRREEERLLRKLIALRTCDSAAPETVMSSSLAGAPNGDRGVKAVVIEAVVDTLKEAARPVHISDLMRVLLGRNVSIPGSGNQANLITYLRRDPRIVRPSRGMYALSEWGLHDMPAAKRKRRRARLRRSKVAVNQRSSSASN
jgi:hypothetical protein